MCMHMVMSCRIHKREVAHVSSNYPGKCLCVICVCRLPEEQRVMAGCDNGCLEIFRVQGPVLCETEGRVQAHDDMVLGVALLAGGEKVVSVGQDKKLV